MTNAQLNLVVGLSILAVQIGLVMGRAQLIGLRNEMAALRNGMLIDKGLDRIEADIKLVIGKLFEWIERQ